MAADDLCYADLVEVGQRIQTRRLSSAEVTQAVLDRIARLDGHLKSYAILTADLGLAQAEQADAEIARGTIRGPLHGVPIAVKDLCHTKGIPTAAGVAIHKDYRPERDATVVTRLREAGGRASGQAATDRGGVHAAPPLDRCAGESLERGILDGRLIEWPWRRDRGRTLLRSSGD
jgi:amidase